MRKKIESAKHRGMIDIIKICKRHPKITVYLEFEDLVDIDEKRRHYAIPKGGVGLGRLPALLRLSEDKSEFEIEPIRKAIDFDIFDTGVKSPEELVSVA